MARVVLFRATVRLSGKTVLITGGATGIGLALAQELSGRGNTVIVCGRRREKLFPKLNVLVNNAGIQRPFDFRKGRAICRTPMRSWPRTSRRPST
jgi:short-subunit dehydrogenase involved in D-alanine esterification of teichoic acids